MKSSRTLWAGTVVAIMAGCASTDGPDTVFMDDRPSADCRPGLRAADAPVCSTVYWSSKDGSVERARRDD